MAGVVGPGAQGRAGRGYAAVARGALWFRPCGPGDVGTCAALEAAGYPADEAASPEALERRQAEAPGGFLVAEREGSGVVGFVCGTQTAADGLTHESMARHDPGGRTLCIHSVCVAEEERRAGVGSRLLQAYLRAVPAALPGVASVRLICKEHLLGFYAAAGFRVEGPSPVVHGADPWTEMGLEIDASSGTARSS